MKPHHIALVACAAAATLLAACEKPATTEKTPAVATVAGDAISETELNMALSRLGELNEAQKAEARSKLLQALVDQRLVVDAAKKAGLDKDPAIAAAMAHASRQVLVEAYAEHKAKDVAKPAEGEISAYFEQHPELFSQRRIYRVQELELQAGPERMADVEAQLMASHSLGDFVTWVKAQGIEGKTALVVKPAEQMPAPLLARLSQMRDGQATVVPGRPGVIVIQQLQESQLQPVTLEQGRQTIERALIAQKRKEIMETDLKALRGVAKIEYASGYAPATDSKAEMDGGKPAEAPAAN